MTDALIRSMSRRPSRALARPGIVLAFAIALSYLVGLWLTWMHARSGGTPLASGALVSHALRVGTIALPALFAASWLGVLLARRVVGTDERAGTPALRSATLTISVAATAAVAFALLEPLHAVLFGGGHHHGGGPLLMQMARDGFLAFLPSLAVAGVLAAILASRAPWSAPDVRGWASSPTRVRRLALPGLVAVLVLAPTALAAQLGSERAVAASGPGTPCPATAPVKHFDVQSIDVKITLNRFGDNDPIGKMYVLSDRVAAVRAEEASG